MSVSRGDHDDNTTRPLKRTWVRALCLASLGFAAEAGANTSNGYNLPVGVTDLSRDMYGLHMEVFWICVAIAVVVFGAMIYSLVKFRHSKGAIPDTTLLHSTQVEIIWTLIPVIILVVMAIPAAKIILKMEDTRNSALSIRVTGYQWKWQYQYMDAAEGINFFSTLARDSNFARQLHSGIDPKSVPNYLLDVDNPLVVPSGTKVRLLLTSQDVIHAWWVPDFGAKRSAIPGFVNELWFLVEPGKEGIYRGQCAALCGRDHGFMPIVVDVRTPDDFKKWVEAQKAAGKQAAAPAGDARGGQSPDGRPRDAAPRSAQILPNQY
jgi:cytochrome c oxidase subunit II